MKNPNKNNNLPRERLRGKLCDLARPDSVVEAVCGASSLKYREWMSTPEAAEYLGLTVGSLRNMTSNGQVPYYKLGKRNRYLAVELRQLLLSQKRGKCNGN